MNTRRWFLVGLMLVGALLLQSVSAFEIDDSYHTEGTINRLTATTLIVSDEAFRVADYVEVRDENGSFLAYSSLKPGDSVLVYVSEGTAVDGQPYLVNKLMLLRQPGNP